MHAGVSRVLESIRKPEYTGENRCLPCTVVNTTIAAGGSVAVGVAFNPLAGLALFGGSLAAIGLRGYLVPGTPTLTKRYLPDRMHRVFGTHLEPPELALDEESVDLETLLLELEIVEPCPDEADLCLRSTFEDTWYALMETLGDETSQREGLAKRLEVETTMVSINYDTAAVSVRYDGDRIGTWPSEAALVADLAVTAVLAEYCPEWTALEEELQGRIVTALRAFLKDCPDCGGEVEGSEKTVESCCSTHTSRSVKCTECDQALLRDVYV